jgi:2-polyprenyl-3-methyl-5-hydroxy-6-metoxy-1,4-benzoquinol methylase
VLGEKILRIVPNGTHEWDKYIDSEDADNAINDRGFVTLGKSGVMIKNPISMEMTEFPNWLRANYMIMSKRI